jgi:hypothetical protein
MLSADRGMNIDAEESVPVLDMMPSERRTRFSTFSAAWTGYRPRVGDEYVFRGSG